MDIQIKKTKLIATFGPAIATEEKLKKVVARGVDVLRFNFSHLTPELAEPYFNLANRVIKKEKRAISLLADLKGPEVRTDSSTSFEAKNGDEIIFNYGVGDAKLGKVGIDHSFLYRLVKKGQCIYADDGRLEFIVKKVVGEAIYLEVVRGGDITPRRAINVPGLDLQLAFLDNRDKMNLRYILQRDFSWLAASFVSSRLDLEALRKFMRVEGREIPIISKIENCKAMDNLTDIITHSDGVMVARGDLALEVPYAEVPALQNLIISKSKERGKVIIVATQMLESMLYNHRPSRAEVTDIYYAVRRKVDAVMLSAETASGKFAEEAVEVMHNIILKTEQTEATSSNYNNTLRYYEENEVFRNHMERMLPMIPICEAGIQLALRLGSKGVLHISLQGDSSPIISSFRAPLMCVVITPNPVVFYRCALYYSVFPVLVQKSMQYLKQIEKAIHYLIELSIIEKGENLVVLYPQGESRLLNSICKIKA